MIVVGAAMSCVVTGCGGGATDAVTTVTVTVGNDAETSESTVSIESMPRAEELTPRGNEVGEIGREMTSGCSGDVCDLTVTITGIEVNPNNCSVSGDGQTVAVRYTIVTGPNLPEDAGDPVASTWMAVDDEGNVDSRPGGNSWTGCGDTANELMPNSRYQLTRPLNVPATHTTLIWRPTGSGQDLIDARGLEFSLGSPT